MENIQTTTEGRVPPHSLEAERSVLGAAMLSEDALLEVAERIKPEDFYDQNHAEIFKAILGLQRRGIPVDMLTVSEELKKQGSLNMVGGRSFIASLSASTPTTSNAAEYAKIVAEKASIRRLIATADDIVTRGYEGSLDAEQMLDYAESGIFEI
jgi:replicative DNA helicase